MWAARSLQTEEWPLTSSSVASSCSNVRITGGTARDLWPPAPVSSEILQHIMQTWADVSSLFDLLLSFLSSSAHLAFDSFTFQELQSEQGDKSSAFSYRCFNADSLKLFVSLQMWWWWWWRTGGRCSSSSSGLLSSIIRFLRRIKVWAADLLMKWVNKCLSPSITLIDPFIWTEPGRSGCQHRRHHSGQPAASLSPR